MTEKTYPMMSGWAPKKLILVVDDEILIRFNYAEELRDGGFDVLEASNSAEALNVLHSHPIDALCTDVRMPGEIDGLGLARLTRASWPQVKIVVISGNIFTLPPASLVDAFFLKPIHATTLLATVTRLVEAAEA